MRAVKQGEDKMWQTFMRTGKAVDYVKYARCVREQADTDVVGSAPMPVPGETCSARNDTQRKDVTG